MQTKDFIPTYRKHGWATIRAHAASKQPVGAWQDRTDEPEDFGPGENVGIRLGQPSGGLVDLDLDTDEAVALAPLYLPPTATFGRASRPRSHWVYQCRDIDRTKKPPHTGVELRSTGAQTIFPPSIHETGEAITWTDATPVSVINGIELTKAFGRLCTAVVLARCVPGLQEGRGVHHAALAVAGVLWRAGATVEEAREVMLPAFEVHAGADPGHRRDAIDSTWEDHDRERTGLPTLKQLIGDVAAGAFARAVELWAESPDRKHADRPLTDAGNAERLVDHFGEDLRYVRGVGWHRFNGRHWEEVDPPIELALKSARILQKSTDPKAAKWGLQSESGARLQTTVRLAGSLSSIRISATDLDADPMLLNVNNGTVDLRTGQLRPHSRGDLITKLAPVDYDPGAEAPRFRQFLLEAMGESEDLVRYLLRLLGYALTGSTEEQIFTVWYGERGCNGKSTLIGLLLDLLGNYAQTIAPEVLLAKRGTVHPTGVADLRGARVALSNETPEGRRWDEALMKALTGSDRIRARRLYGDHFEFDPTHLLVFAANSRPLVREVSDAFWRRLSVIPWAVSFRGREDRKLPEALRAEAAGVLAMLVRGCVEWQEQGLNPPQAVLDAVADYRQSQDVIGSFFDDVCELNDAVSTKRSLVYDAYRRWALASGETPYTASAFYRILGERGHPSKKVQGARLLEGIGIRKAGPLQAVPAA